MGGTINVHVPGIDYLTTLDRWLASQRGLGPFPYKDGIKFDTPARYIRTGRDLASYVHTDPLGGLFMSFYNAGIWLYENQAPFNRGNPYLDLAHTNQAPFATFGVPFFWV